MSATINRMYHLCIGRLEEAEHAGHFNGHHMAQKMSMLAQAANLSDQQYKCFLLFYDKNLVLTAKQVGDKMKLTSKHASAILWKLKSLNLIDGSKKGYPYCVNSFIRKL
jgi:DNA-binding MarR family transcriptional regulator